MTLKELLEYRSKCFIHNLPMKPSCFRSNGDQILLTDQGLHLVSEDLSSGLSFHFDGLFINTTKPYVSVMIFIYMMCDLCAKEPILKDRYPPIGYSSLLNINTNQHRYTFCLQGNDKGGFDGRLSRESIKYVRDGKFYHVDFDLVDKQGSCKMGSCDMKQTLDDLVSKMMNLHVPVFDASKIQNIDTLVEKLKLYNLFS